MMPAKMKISEYMLKYVKKYYDKKHSIFGSDGDFITSPYICSLFNQTIGLWLRNHCFSINNEDKKLRFIELGPGNGILIADIINVWID